jgi:hypothetical protein
LEFQSAFYACRKNLPYYSTDCARFLLELTDIGRQALLHCQRAAGGADFVQTKQRHADDHHEVM